MASDPKVDVYMPIFVGDLLADTLHLHTEQFGAFMFLLFHQWRVGHFNEDEVAQITRLAGSSHLSASSSAKQELSRLLAPVIQLLARDPAGQLFSRRADKEKEAALTKKKAFVDRARKGGEAKAKKYRERMANKGSASSTPKEVLEPCTSPSLEEPTTSAPSLRSVAAAGTGSLSASSTPPSTLEQPPGEKPPEAPQSPPGEAGGGDGGKALENGRVKSALPQQPGAQNSATPDQKAGGPDPRFSPFKQEVQAYWKGQNPDGQECPWDAAEQKALAAMLKASPGLDLNGFRQLLEHRAASDVNPADMPRAWLRELMRFHAGPLDRFQKLKRGGRVL